MITTSIEWKRKMQILSWEMSHSTSPRAVQSTEKSEGRHDNTEKSVGRHDNTEESVGRHDNTEKSVGRHDNTD